MSHLNNVFSHILLCNLLTTILRPNFEEPLDTAKQLVEKNITVFSIPGHFIWKQFLLESSVIEYKILEETYTIPNNWDNFSDIIEHDVMGAGTHALMISYLIPSELAMGRWYRSKEKIASNHPYAGYLTNKKWHLNEVLPIQYETMRLFILIMTFKEMANHLLYFQQVGIIYNI